MSDDLEKIDIKKTYADTYTMRKVGGSITTTVPKKVVERKAKELGISVEELIENYVVTMLYNSFKDIDCAFIFEKKENKKDSKSSEVQDDKNKK